MSKVVKLRSNKYKIVQKYKTEIDCTNYKIIQILIQLLFTDMVTVVAFL